MTTTHARVLVGLLTALGAACSSGPSPNPNLAPLNDRERTLASQPSWYVNVPTDTNNLYAAATETSRDLQMALDKAKLRARTELATQVEAKIESRQKLFGQETGADTASELMRQFDDAQKVIVSQVINGTRVAQQVTVPEGEVFRSYVLMQMPVGPANVALMSRIRQNALMYTRLRATKAFAELEKDVERFEQEKRAPR